MANRALVGLGLLALSSAPTWSAVNVLLTEAPDYSWYAGCFGTASGNLMGYWDRHGFPNFYTGPTAGGVAPLHSNGANEGIRSMWASRAGFDGRPADQFGHIDDYWIHYRDNFNYSYESTALDPYVTAGRTEHAPDCLGDFIGLSQNKWKSLNGECDGNIDAFSFVFWETNGTRRLNFIPPPENEIPLRDIPSGLRAWTKYRGNEAEVFSQLTDFNPNVPAGQGFTFANLKAEIDAGYPVLLFLQPFEQLFRNLPGMEQANPYMHGMLAYGYYVRDDGTEFVRYKTSWGGSGDSTLSQWDAGLWQADLPVRGVIGYRPLPQITSVVQTNGSITLEWHGPSSMRSDLITRATTPLHWYVVEKASALNPTDFVTVSEPSVEHSATISNCCEASVFFRLKLVPPPSEGSLQ